MIGDHVLVQHTLPCLTVSNPPTYEDVCKRLVWRVSSTPDKQGVELMIDSRFVAPDEGVEGFKFIPDNEKHNLV